MTIRRTVTSHWAASLAAFDAFVVRSVVRKTRCVRKTRRRERTGHRGRELPCRNHRDPQLCQAFYFFVVEERLPFGAHTTHRARFENYVGLPSRLVSDRHP